MNLTSQPVAAANYKPFNENNARNIKLSSDIMDDAALLNYCKAGYEAFKKEVAADGKANTAGLDVVKNIVAARVFLSLFDKKMDVATFREYVIRQMFKIKGSVKACPQKSSIYAKIKAANDLILAKKEIFSKINRQQPAESIEKAVGIAFADFSGLRDLYAQLKATKKATKDAAATVAATKIEALRENATPEEAAQIAVNELTAVAATFIEKFESVAAAAGVAAALNVVADVADIIINAYNDAATNASDDAATNASDNMKKAA